MEAISAMRVGPFVSVTGCAGEQGDVQAQTLAALHAVEAQLRILGASLPDVIRTRLFVAPGADCDQVRQTHRTFFDGLLISTQLISGVPMGDPARLVEIEVDALVGEA